MSDASIKWEQKTAQLSTGITMSYVDKGQGIPVVLCHGWPELSFSWRHQIDPLVNAGFRVIAPDQRGFGNTSRPPNVSDYSQENIRADLLALMDHLQLPKVVVIGHDWGGLFVWQFALSHPSRVYAVGSLCTPLLPVDPTKDSLTALKENPRQFDYMLYFQDEGVAEKEFEQDIRHFFNCMFRSTKPEDKLPVPFSSSDVRARGGFLVGMPKDVPRSKMVSDPEFNYYVAQFTKSGFRGGLNWYRNQVENWKKSVETINQKILCPALMLCAAKDPVLPPIMTTGMEARVPNLTRYTVENAGHWVQQEAKEEVNEVLIKWLRSLELK